MAVMTGAALYTGDLLGGDALDEIAERDRTLGRRDLHGLEGGGVTAFGGEPDAYVQLILGVVRPEPADQDTAGQVLDRLTHRNHVDAIAARRLSIDGQRPLDARRRAVVFHFNQLRICLQPGLDQVCRAGERRGVRAPQLDLDGLAGGRAALGLAHLNLKS